MSAVPVLINTHRAGWLRSVPFDLSYIVGTASLALASGWVVFNPALFVTVFLLNAWFLGYHHVVSTFTRLTFDKASFKEHRFLVTWLPVTVLAGVVLICMTLGTSILTTVYLYWQWWHYTRQSYGVSRIYQRKARLSNDVLHKLVIYAVPLWGILYRSAQAPQEFLFTEVKVVPVPSWVVGTAGAFAILVVGCWVAQIIRDWIFGSVSIAHTLYLSSHLLIFGVGYLAIDDLNHGWLVLTVWHNSQYILTVWMFNNTRFKNQLHPEHKFLSSISQRKRIVTYFAVCLTISTAIYSVLQFSLGWFVVATTTSLPLFTMVFQAVNFHHYVVDAVIWKVRQKPVRENFGIAN